jgi:Leucine Rich repeat
VAAEDVAPLLALSQLLHLDLAKTRCRCAGVAALAPCWPALRGLTYLNLSNTDVTSADVSALARDAGSLTQLRALDLSRTAIAAAAALASWVARQPALERLALQQTHLASAGVEAVLRALRGARQLTHLDLSKCKACPSTMLRLVTELVACPRLVRLGMPDRDCQAGEAGSGEDVDQAVAELWPQTRAALSALTHFAPPADLVGPLRPQAPLRPACHTSRRWVSSSCVAGMLTAKKTAKQTTSALHNVSIGILLTGLTTQEKTAGLRR